MDAKTARAHFGLAKLAITKLKGKDALLSIKRAVELDPKEPLYRLYESEAWALEKSHAEQVKALEAYVRLNPTNAEDRLTEAKAGLELLRALGSKPIAAVDAPEAPAPIRLRPSLLSKRATNWSPHKTGSV